MNLTNRIALLALSFVLLSLTLTAQDSTGVIHLSVLRNGASDSPPQEVTLTFGGLAVVESVKGGSFQFPLDVLKSKSPITFSAVVGKDQIRATVTTGGFRTDEWVLILEDKDFDDEYKPLPRGAKVQSSCVLVFGSESADSTNAFYPHCRTKAK
jgi:hypothetical protein